MNWDIDIDWEPETEWEEIEITWVLEDTPWNLENDSWEDFELVEGYTNDYSWD